MDTEEHVPNNSVAFLAGGGEMGALMRAKDWSGTPLGPPRSWPQSLKTTVRILLDSRYAMWMAWGPTLTFFCNDAYRPTLGTKRDWALGCPASLVWAEIWKPISERLDRVFETRQATWDEGLLLFLERSGYPEETYHTFSYSPLYDDQGHVGGMLCVVTEETDRIIGERRLALLRDVASSLAAVTTEEEVFAGLRRSLAADARDLPFTLTYLFDETRQQARLVCHSGIDATHPAAAPRIDLQAPWPIEEVLHTLVPVSVAGLPARFRDLPSGPWDRAPAQALVLPIAQQGQSQPAGVFITALNPYRALDDEYRGFVSLFVGQIAAALANVRAHEEERKRVAALAELDRAKTTFFSNVSHEFRTPLTLMMGPLEDVLADRADALSASHRVRLETAHRNSLRLLKLVNTLLDFSRIEAGRMQASFEPVELGQLTTELANVFESAVMRADMQLIIDSPRLDQPVHVDRDMWEKIVLNLVSNAFKYTLKGSIQVRQRRVGEQVELRVSDTGTGIPAESLPQLFERFYRVPNALGRTHEGTGIGLSLVYELVKLHGGSITVESRVGEGTTFTVLLPLGVAHLPADRIRKAPGLASTAVGAEAFREEAMLWLSDEGRLHTGNTDTHAALRDDTGTQAALGNSFGRVVLADDNADMREYIRRLLAGAGYEVFPVADGLTALAAVRELRPDLVLSDVMMPRLDGLGLLAALREDMATRQIPVILLSARAGEEARSEGLEHGADDYLTKPFTTRELLARVGSTLSSARIRQVSQETLREETRVLAALNRVGRAVAAELDMERVVQVVTDAATELSGAAWGAFFYNVIDEHGKKFRLYALSGATREDFAAFPMPRATDVFAPTFNGEGIVRSDDIRQDPRYGRMAPYNGLPENHLPVRSYLAAPVASRSGEVIGGMFFGHPETGVFTERSERLVAGIASQAAIALDNARLYDGAQKEIAVRTQIEVALRESEERLREADRRKDEFLAMLSHELRNPLAPIRNGLQIMKLAGLSGPSQQHAYNLVHRQVAHLMRLVDDLLDVSRITRGKLDLQREQVSLASVIHDAVDTARPLLDAASHELSIESPPASLEVHADPVRLTQVFANLLGNSAKYTPPHGQIRISAHVAASANAGAAQEVEVIVEDNGIGIPPESLPSVFEMFTQVSREKGRSSSGLGIGLALVKGLVEMHDGRVWAESAGENQGSRFVVRLPRVVPKEVSQTAAPGAIDADTSSAPKRVLVVDDNVDAAESMSMLLELQGHETRMAHDGLEAIEVARAFTPDLILMDIGMPRMDGLEAARRIRELALEPRPMIVALTGWGQDVDRRNSLAAGIDRHLVKPVEPRTLCELLEQT